MAPRFFSSVVAGLDTPTLQSLLLTSAFDGNKLAFQKLAEKLDKYGEGIEKVVKRVRGPDGKSPLHSAVSGNNKIQMSKYLVQQLHFDVNLQDHTGETPLHGTTLDGDYAISAYLLDHGADPNITTKMGLTPLHLAAKKGYKDLLRLLISKGAKVDALSAIGTPLHHALTFGVADSVKILLEHHANPNLVCPGAFPPLIVAVQSKSIECVNLMLEWGADPNISSCGLTPLAEAASLGQIEMISCLLKASGDPNACDFVKMEKKFREAKAKGAEAFRKGDYMNAIHWYTEAIAAKPRDAAVFSNRSLCWARMNDGSRALDDAIVCVMLSKDWPKAHYRVGVAWQLLREYRRAVLEFGMALEIDPDNKEIQDAYRAALDAQAAATRQSVVEE